MNTSTVENQIKPLIPNKESTRNEDATNPSSTFRENTAEEAEDLLNSFVPHPQATKQSNFVPIKQTKNYFCAAWPLCTEKGNACGKSYVYQCKVYGKYLRSNTGARKVLKNRRDAKMRRLRKNKSNQQSNTLETNDTSSSIASPSSISLGTQSNQQCRVVETTNYGTGTTRGRVLVPVSKLLGICSIDGCIITDKSPDHHCARGACRADIHNLCGQSRNLNSDDNEF